MDYLTDCLDYVISLHKEMGVKFANYKEFDSPIETSRTLNHH
jgi:hypothetical protein